MLLSTRVSHFWQLVFFSCRVVSPCGANCEPVPLRTTLRRGGCAVRSCWISSFSVKTRSPSENLWTCRNTRYLSIKLSLSLSSSIVLHVNSAFLRNIRLKWISIFSYRFFGSWNFTMQFRPGHKWPRFNYTKSGGFEARVFFRPLHSASVMKTEANGKVVREKQCEVSQFQWATILFVNRKLEFFCFSFFFPPSPFKVKPRILQISYVFTLSSSPLLLYCVPIFWNV